MVRVRSSVGRRGWGEAPEGSSKPPVWGRVWAELENKVGAGVEEQHQVNIMRRISFPSLSSRLEEVKTFRSMQLYQHHILMMMGVFDSFAQGDSITDTSRDLQTQPNRQTHMVHVSMVLHHMGLPYMFLVFVSITLESIFAVDGQLSYERFQKMDHPSFTVSRVRMLMSF